MVTQRYSRHGIRLRFPVVRQFFAVLLLACGLVVHAQPENNTRDNVRINQFWVAENGSGNLSANGAQPFYQALHKSYYQNLANYPNSKAFYRTSEIAATKDATRHTKEIDSAMVKRGKIDLANWTEGQSVSNLAWRMEKGKFERKYDNINKLLQYFTSWGGTIARRDYYQLCFDRIKEGVDVANGGFQTNGARHNQLEGLYQELVQLETDISDYCLACSNFRDAMKDSTVLRRRVKIPYRKSHASIIRARLNKWQEKMYSLVQ